MDRNNRQEYQWLIKNQQQKWQGQNCTTKPQSGADKTTPDENQGNQKILYKRKLRHRLPGQE